MKSDQVVIVAAPAVAPPISPEPSGPDAPADPVAPPPAGEPPPAAADPLWLVAPAVSIRASPRSARLGLSAGLPGVERGERVDIQLVVGSRWRSVARVRAGARGVVRYTLVLTPRQAAGRSVVPMRFRAGGAVLPAAPLRVPPSALALTLRATARLPAAAAGRAVLLQARVGGRFRTIERLVVRSDGGLSVRMAVTGRHLGTAPRAVVRLLLPAAGGLSAAVSPVREARIPQGRMAARGGR